MDARVVVAVVIVIITITVIISMANDHRYGDHAGDPPDLADPGGGCGALPTIKERAILGRASTAQPSRSAPKRNNIAF